MRTNICYLAFLRQVVFFITVVIIAVSCVAPVQITRETSLSQRPSWIDRPPHESDIFYFVGIYSFAETLEQGYGGAIKDAISKIADFLGIRIESVFESTITESEQRLKENIISKSSATVHGARVIDSYYEKQIRIDKDFKTDRYDVYVLMSFSKAEAAKESVRQQKENSANVKSAQNHFTNGVALEKSGDYDGAIRNYATALNILAGIEGFKLIDGVGTNNKGLAYEIETRLQEIKEKFSEISLNMRVDWPHSGYKAFRISFASSLNENGFKLTDKNSLMWVLGDIALSESGYIMGNYVYYAEGAVSLKKTADGSTISIFPIKAKGFHKTREQAALNAFREAGMEAAMAVSGRLRSFQILK